MAAAIVADQVSKRFLLHRRKATSLKERFIHRHDEADELWAVRDLSLEVGRGETVGLIGANGSGKSTTLKLLAGILQPTSGTVAVHGRVASLLELGAGFNGELSGRDNVYLNASLLGLTRREVNKHFDAIVAFSELGDFIDNQVKNYSSGMYVRLGFAVAVHVDPDILLVDEVLSVGDEAFQQKCLAKIEEFQQEGRTILLVSHALDLVEKVCSRAVVLDHGVLRFAGEPSFATAELRNILGTGTPPSEDAPAVTNTARIHAAVVSAEPGGERRGAFAPGEPFAVRVEVEVMPGHGGGEVVVTVVGPADFPVWTMGSNGDVVVPDQPGRYVVDFVVPATPPVIGAYVVAAFMRDPRTREIIAAERFYDPFTVRGTASLGLLDVPYAAEISRADS